MRQDTTIRSIITDLQQPKKKFEIFSGWDENNGNSKIVLFKYEKTTLVKTLSLVIIVTKASG
jgi:hypothetical protein